MATLIDKVYSLNIGVQGENIARAIELDMTEWVAAYPGASFHVLFKPYNESEAVPMVSTFEDNILTWTPTLSATVVSGVGYTEIRALDPETGLIRKSRIIPTSVENSVTGVDENPPQPYADWVNRVLEAGSDAVKGAAAVAAVSQGEEVAFEIDADGHLNIVYTESGEPQTLDLGPVDAYAIAVAEGYTGTREEWVQAMADAEANGLKAEGYAIGKQNGVAVESGEYYQNNAKYYNEQAQSAKEDAEAAQTAAETAQTAAEAAQTSAEASATEAAQYTSTAVHTWLENNVDPATGYVLDRTLMEPLEAAPADMVGDLKSALKNTEELTFAGEAGNDVVLTSGFVKGWWDGSTFKTSTLYTSIDIPVPDNLEGVTYTVLSNVNTVGYFIDENGTAVTSFSGQGAGTKKYMKPSTAKRIRVNFFGSTYYDGVTFIFRKPSDELNRIREFENAIDSGNDITLTKGFEQGSWSNSTTFSVNIYTSLKMSVPDNLTEVHYTILSNVNDVGFILDATGTVLDTLKGTPTGIHSHIIPKNAKTIICNFFGNTYYNGITFTFKSVNKRVDELSTIDCRGKTAGSTEITATKCNGYIINSHGGITSMTNQNYFVDRFPVEAWKSYVVSGITKIASDAYPLSSFLSSDVNETEANTIILIPAGDTATGKYREISFTPMVNGYIYVAGYQDNGRMNVHEAVDCVSGMYPLKIQAFGDSITDDTWGTRKYSWASALKDYLPITINLTNSGVAGSRIIHSHSSDGRYAEKEWNGIYDLVTDGTMAIDNNIIIIFAGTNDWQDATPFGTWNEDVTTKFIPALQKICQYITTNTKSLLVFCTPINRYNTSDQGKSTDEKGAPINSINKTLRDYCDAILEVCHFYGVPVIDLNYDVGFTRQNIGQFTADGLHPGIEGSKIISKYIAGAMRKHYGL